MKISETYSKAYLIWLNSDRTGPQPYPWKVGTEAHSLRPVIQEPCDIGLFSDEKDQLDLADMPMFMD